MVAPSRTTGARSATGVILPNRPMLMKMPLRRVVACWDGNFQAMAHRGVVPRSAELLLVAQLIDLNHDAVGFEWQVRAQA